MASTVFKDEDPEFGKVDFGSLVRSYGPQLGFAGYVEEVTGNVPGAPPSVASDFLTQYLKTLYV